MKPFTDETTSPLISWLQASWPQYNWQDAEVHEACFHDVAICPSAVVARVSRHGEQTERVGREHHVLRLLADVRLPYDIPRPLSGVVTRDGRTGMLTSFVAGTPRPDFAWETAADQIRYALEAFAPAAGQQLIERLPRPRAWCAGSLWPALVPSHLVPR